MRKLILLSLLALWPLRPAFAAQTGMPGGIWVGSVSANTYTLVTAVASSYVQLPLTSIFPGDGMSPLAAVAVPGVYFGQTTGLTNTPCVKFPATNSVTATVQVPIPYNYRSGGQLNFVVHASTGITTNNISITADVYTVTPGGLTVTTKAAGTLVAITSAQAPDTMPVVVGLTNTNAVYAPGGLASFKINVDGTAAIKEVLAVYFSYRPSGAINGR